MPRKKTPDKELFVAYYRVSTKKQDQDMATQKRAIKKYLGNRWPPAKEFIEQESGKSDHNREQLKEALEFTYEKKGTLLVAKLDRLSRDLEFVGWIQNTDLKFVCCDMPHATREMIGIMGVMARWEREQIAQRTRDALAERKKAGVKLGSQNPKVRKALEKLWKKRAQDKKKAREKKKKEQVKIYGKDLKKAPPKKLTKAQISDQRVIPVIKVMRSEHKTFEQIADALNAEGIPSRWGKRWYKQSVLRVADRNDLE